MLLELPNLTLTMGSIGIGRADISTLVSAAIAADFTVHATLLSDTQVIYYNIGQHGKTYGMKSHTPSSKPKIYISGRKQTLLSITYQVYIQIHKQRSTRPIARNKPDLKYREYRGTDCFQSQHTCYRDCGSCLLGRSSVIRIEGCDASIINAVGVAGIEP